MMTDIIDTHVPKSVLAPIRHRIFLNELPRFSRRFSSHAFETGGFAATEDDFAVLVSGTRNVGDEMQTIAQLGFLPATGGSACVNRDYLDKYKGRRRILITNGWHTHNTANWPPSPELEPVLVSFHMAGEWRPSQEAVNYLKRNEPIGCRDISSVNRLKSLGVKAYFSGCLTLTLENPYAAERAQGPVVICDADLGYDGGYPPSAHTLFKRLVPATVCEDAIVLKQEINPWRRHQYLWKTRKVLDHLELYAKAKLVITSRLHCALPCLALGTPVIFLHQNYDNDPRFDGFRKILRGHGPAAKEIEIDWSDPQPTDITAYREHVTSSTLRSLTAALERLKQ